MAVWHSGTVGDYGMMQLLIPFLIVITLQTGCDAFQTIDQRQLVVYIIQCHAYSNNKPYHNSYINIYQYMLNMYIYMYQVESVYTS